MIFLLIALPYLWRLAPSNSDRNKISEKRSCCLCSYRKKVSFFPYCSLRSFGIQKRDAHVFPKREYPYMYPPGAWLSIQRQISSNISSMGAVQIAYCPRTRG